MQLKAASIVNNIALLRERLSAEKFAQLEAALPENSRKLLARNILAVEWIEGAVWFPFQETVRKQLGDASFRALMHEVCERDFNGIYKFFMRNFVSPSLVVSRATKVLETYARGSELRVEDKGTAQSVRHLVVHMRSNETHPMWPVLVEAFMEKLLLLAGASELSVAHENVVQGSSLQTTFNIHYRG
jgi:hypothetical protein